MRIAGVSQLILDILADDRGYRPDFLWVSHRQFLCAIVPGWFNGYRTVHNEYLSV
jgi:hypothetical protein